MPTKIVLLPLRIGLRVTRFVVHPVTGVIERAVDALIGGDGSDGAQAAPQRPPSTWRPTSPPPATRPETEVAAPAAPPEPEEPEHVSEEPVLVAESADEGAEEGVGAAISIAEPWEGYRRMKAAEVLERIEAASREELAVIELYEGMNRRRKTVLEAAERRLKTESGPASRRP
jgi:hypothetical protein